MTNSPISGARSISAALGRGSLALLVGLAGAGIGLLAPSVAHAANASVGLYLSAPGVEGPSLAGATIEDFSAYDGVAAVSPTTLSSSTSLAIGSTSAGSMKAAFSGVGASTTSDSVVSWGRTGGSGIGFVDAGGTVTITLGSSRNYFGFLWLAGDATNTFVLRSGGKEVATFSTRDIISLVPKTAGTVTANGGATYTKTDYYGSRYHTQGPGPSFTCGTCTEPYAFIHAVAPAGVTFDEVQFRQGAGGGFEFDNLTVANYSGSFDITGLVGVPMDQLTNDEYTVAVGANLSENIGANDTTLSGSTFSKVTDPSMGIASLSSTGALVFVPGSTTGVTTFDYKVCRPAPSTTCVTATVTITITAASSVTTTTSTTIAGATTTIAPSDTTPVDSSASTDTGSEDDSDLPNSGQPMWILTMMALALVIIGLRLVPMVASNDD